MRPAPEDEWSEARAHRPGQFFSFLSPGILRDFRTFTSLVRYPPRAVLFEEEQEASCILILVEGCAKISMNSSDGKRLILWIARPAELLGLTSVLRGSSHEVTAETVHPCTIASIGRQEFLDFLMRHPAAHECIMRELILEMSRACEHLRIMGLSSSATAKLARLLLEWSAGARPVARGTSVSVPFTHGEMGECIGVTRETVTRAMAELRERRLVDVHGSAVFIRNRFALEAFAHGLHRAISPAVLAHRARRPRFSVTHPREVTVITAGR